MDKVRAEVRIKGKVQGVFFRQSTRTTALSLNLAGWVRNLPDGDVEAVFEGTEQAIQNMLAWCNNGPSAARVDTLTVKHSKPTGEFATFNVR